MQLTGVLTAAVEVQSFCQRRGWKCCIIGGLAVVRWGNPRFTQDVDLTLVTGFGNEESFVDALLAEYMPRRANAREFALTHRVLLARTSAGIDVDIALGALPFEERSIQRASIWSWAENQTLITCSAEDLITHKVFAGRDRDWSDIEGVLLRQHGNLDLGSIRSELVFLLDLKGEIESLDRFELLIVTVDRRIKYNI